MAWYTMANPNGRGGWAFNPDGAAHIIRSNHYNRELVQRSRVIRRDHGFGMPTTAEVETNFSGIRAAVNRTARVTVDQLDRDFANNPQRLYEWLVHVREDGETAGDAYRRMTHAATQESARNIQGSVQMWTNAVAAARFVRDASAGILLAGATVLTGGAAATTVGLVGGTALTFTGNTQDNLQSNPTMTMQQAMGRAAVSTSVAVVTSVLIPRGLGQASNAMLGAARMTMGQNVALGLISVQANVAGDMVKTALTSDTAAGPVAETAAAAMRRQLGARSGFEISAMLFQSWLASRGIPAAAFLRNNEDVVTSVTGGVLSAVGDRIVTAITEQNNQANQTGVGGANPGDLDITLTRLQHTMNAEAYVRELAMRPA